MFLSVFSCDRLPSRFDVPALIVCNTDLHDAPGEHRVVLYLKSGSYGEFLDSFGLQSQVKSSQVPFI